MPLLFNYLRYSLGALAALASSAAFADESWAILAGAGTQHDSNLYRTIEQFESSDTINSTYVGLRLDKEYSLQHFTIDAVTTDFRYQRNDDLDYRGHNIDASWRWTASRFLSGKLALYSDEMISSFADYNGRSRNIRTVEGWRLDADLLVWTRWYGIAGVSRQKLENSAIFLAEGDYESGSAEYGLKYQTPSGSNVVLANRITDGEYDNRIVNPMLRIDSGFKQIDAQTRFVWLASAKSRLTGRLGYMEREHDNYGERDFSGAVGSLDYTWDVTAKFQITASLKQDLLSYQSSPQSDIYLYLVDGSYFNSSYYQQRVLEVVPAWQITSKTSLRLRYREEERDYKGGLIRGLEERDDAITQISVALVWAPIDVLSLSVSLLKDQRASSRDTADYVSDVAGLSLNLAF